MQLTILVIIFSVMISASAYLLGKLSLTGAIIGGFISLLIYFGTGVAGFLMLGWFFMIGTLATSWNFTVKMRMGLAKPLDRRRTVGQVLANSGVAAVLGIAGILKSELQSLMLLMTAGAFSSAAADTISSELGSLYGKRFFNIIDLSPGKRGLNGMVSMEGLFFGLLASASVALIYSAGNFVLMGFLVIVFAGTVGNIVDSILGASFENRGLIKNNLVNFLNTLAGAISAYVLSGFL